MGHAGPAPWIQWIGLQQWMRSCNLDLGTNVPEMNPMYLVLHRYCSYFILPLLPQGDQSTQMPDHRFFDAFIAIPTFAVQHSLQVSYGSTCDISH